MQRVPAICRRAGWARRTLLAAAACLMLCAATCGMASRAVAAEPSRPNILLLVSDDQRPDTIAALGNPHIHTPNLDRLVREGVAFTRAVCANPICTPSRAEILTGCDGFTGGVLDFSQPIRAELATFAGTLQKAGYHTWYVGKWHNDGRPTQRGYEETRGLFRTGGAQWMPKDPRDWSGRPATGYRGWVFQDDQGNLFPERGVGLKPDIAASFADAAIEFIQRKPERPFFLHVNFTSPHDPLLLPPGYEKRYAADKLPLPPNFLPEHPFDHGNLKGRDELLFQFPRTPEEVRGELAAYYAVISYMDEQLGRILAALRETGQDSNTIVVFTSDHGLAVGSHGLRGKQSMYEHTINVPMIWRGPGIPQNERRQAQVYLREIFPTCCELAGVDIPDTVQGKSFAAVLRALTKDRHHEEVFGYYRTFQRMIRNDRFKLIEYPAIGRVQLFDLKNDPYERNDLADVAEHAQRIAALRDKLHAWQRQVNDPVLPRPAKE